MAAGIRLDFQAINRAAEFDLAYRNRTLEHRQHLADTGITSQAMLRAGDLGVARIATTGRLYTPHPNGFPAVILAVWAPAPPSIYSPVENPAILDLLALRLDKPSTCWHRIGEPDLVLGEDQYLTSIETGAPLKVHDSPLCWLQGGCDGTVFLDDCEARWSAERFAEDEAALADWWRAAS